MPRVFIGIVTYNSLRDLPKCFAGIRAQTHGDMEIHVADNASGDGSAEWIQQHIPEAMLIRNDENLGYGRAHNQILREIRPESEDYYLTLNPDVIMRPAYIAELLASLERQGAGWGTGKLMLMDEKGAETDQVYSAGHAILRDGYFFNIGHGMVDEGQFDEPREVFGAPGAAALYSYSLIRSVSIEGKFFEEDFFLYGEDTDIDWRARNQGWRCWYQPSAVAYHRGSKADEDAQVEAVAHRYLSALMNARVEDLLLYNIPLMVLHMLFRLAATPRQGMHLLGMLFRHAPKMIAQRSGGGMSKDEARLWFRWSREQSTSQPKTIGARLRHGCISQ